MIALLIFALSVVITARAISNLIWRRYSTDPPKFFEAAASTAVLALSLAIAISWALSWLRMLSQGPLLLTAVALAIPSIAVLSRRRAEASRGGGDVIEAWQIVLFAPLIVWIAFVLWRGMIVPALSHDALAYHLPKAVMMARAHEFAFFNAPDPRISTSPANYELLLADVLLLTGSDEVTEWVGTAAYLALLLLAAALAERWWGDGEHVLITAVLVAAVPVILLHAGAHKNDLLANVFYLGAILWTARWFVTQDGASLVIALTSLASAGGTKLQAVFPAAALIAIFVWLAIRRRLRVTRALLVTIAAAFAAALLLLGGWAYVANLLNTGQAGLPASSSSDAGYGDWRNVWEVPLLVLLRPFDSSRLDVLVPWRGERWFWPLHELYFSDFGVLVTILAVALPLAIWRYGKRWGSPAQWSERALGSVAALAAFVLMLPIRIRPLGFFAGFPRYFVFVPVFVIAWTVAPLVKELSLRAKGFAVKAIATASAAFLVVTAGVYTVNDRFQPLEYVRYVTEHRQTRRPYFAGYRAATVVDAVAGPTDTIAIHAGFDSWIHPLYGRALRRNVIFIEPGQPIPREARFVLVDRAWNIHWGHPDFENTGQYRRYLSRGTPTEEDVAVLKSLVKDPRYELLYHLPARNQAVFRRRDS